MTTAPSVSPSTRAGRDPRWRVLIWGVPVVLLTLPGIAMRFTAEVEWTALDFVVMGTMLAIAAGAVDAVTSGTGGFARKATGLLTVVGLFLLVWINLAVGMIGDEGDPANWLFAGVIAVIVGGACVARMRGRGMAGAMAKAMVGAAAVQAGIGAAALLLGWGADGRGYPMDVIGATAMFTTLWLAAAALFRAGRG